MHCSQINTIMEVDGTTPKGWYINIIIITVCPHYFCQKKTAPLCHLRNFHHLLISKKTKPQALGPQSQAALPHELQGLAPATHHWAKMIAALPVTPHAMLPVSETALLHSKRSEKVAKKYGSFFSHLRQASRVCVHTCYTFCLQLHQNMGWTFTSFLQRWMSFLAIFSESGSQLVECLEVFIFSRPWAVTWNKEAPPSRAKSLGANCTTTLRTSKSTACKVWRDSYPPIWMNKEWVQPLKDSVSGTWSSITFVGGKQTCFSVPDICRLRCLWTWRPACTSHTYAELC